MNDCRRLRRILLPQKAANHPGQLWRGTGHVDPSGQNNPTITLKRHAKERADESTTANGVLQQPFKVSKSGANRDVTDAINCSEKSRVCCALGVFQVGENNAGNDEMSLRNCLWPCVSMLLGGF